jgi:hypothetical protein
MSTVTNSQAQPVVPISPIKTNTDTNTSQTTKTTNSTAPTSTTSQQQQDKPPLNTERQIKSNADISLKRSDMCCLTSLTV